MAKASAPAPSPLDDLEATWRQAAPRRRVNREARVRVEWSVPTLVVTAVILIWAGASLVL
ncbi:MAG: hypothetical protein ACTJHU_12125 [Mycetocola sp.]